MTFRSTDMNRDETIRHLAHRLLMEQGWPESGNLDDYYARAKEIYDAGLMGMAFGGPIPASLMREGNASPRKA